MKYYSFLFLVLMMISCSNSISEKEFNNDFSTANRIDSIENIVSGMVSKTDVDFYYIVPKKGYVVDIHIIKTSSAFLDLFLYNQEKQTIGFSTNHQYSLKNYKAEGFYIKLSSIEENKYEVQVSYKKDFLFEQEPNDILLEASKIEINKVIKASLRPFTQLQDRDFYHIKIPEKIHQYQKVMSLSIHVSLEKKELFGINLYKIDGSLVYGVFLKDEDSFLSIDRYAIRDPYEYYIEIYSLEEALKKRVDYELMTEITTYSKNVEYEPNDTPTQAVTINEDIEEIRGYIVSKSDVDYYKLNIDKGLYSIFNIIVIPPSNLSIKIEVVDLFNNVITQSSEGDEGKSGNIYNFYAQEKEYFLKVTSPNGQISKNPYSIKIFYRNYEKGTEKEPNDHFSQSTLVRINKNNQGIFSHLKDVDFFKIQIPDKDTFDFHFSLPKDIRMNIIVYNKNEREIGTLKYENMIQKMSSFSIRMFQNISYEEEEGKLSFSMNLNNDEYYLKFEPHLDYSFDQSQFYYFQIKKN